MALANFINSISWRLTRVLPALFLAVAPGLVLSQGQSQDQLQQQPQEQRTDGQAKQDAEAGDSADPGIEGLGIVERSFSQSGLGAAALAQHLPHLTVWLEPENSPRVLALFEREVSAEADGAVVVLSDEGQTANDRLLEGLRKRLTDAGWATMTLGLESPSIALQRAREQAAVGSGDQVDKSSEEAPAGQSVIDVNEQAVADLLDSHRQTLNARQQAAVEWLNAQDYGNVVLVGVGRGANAVREYLPDAHGSVRRVAWVGADFGGLNPAQAAESLVGVEGIPILDLYSSRQTGVDERRAAFTRAGIREYRAIPMAVDVRPRPRAAGPIANRLIGWLQPGPS